MNLRSVFERSTLVFLILFFLGGVFLFDLYRKQVLDHSKYAAAASSQSTSSDPTPAERGLISLLDKDGKTYTLATNVWKYKLILVPRQVKNVNTLLSELKKDLPTLDAATITPQLEAKKLYLPPVLSGIDVTTARTIMDKNYAGVYLQPEVVRVYPENERMAAQVLGFVGNDGIGKYGVEAIYDSQLRGQAGDEKTKRDSIGRLIDILGVQQPEAGQDLVLTLDYNLQYYVEGQLVEAIKNYQADSGQIIIMDPKTGAILAVAGQPTYDPNSYGQLSGEEQRRFLLPAASDMYEPGSVIKPVTMSMAIDMGLLTPDTVKVFGGSVQVLDKLIHNSQDKVYGKENMTQVLENSDNVAMVWVSSLIGADKQREYIDKFGFGAKTGLDVVGEQTGIVPAKKDWNDLKRANTAFGQGFSVTLVQLAQAYSVIANGGKTVTPHLVAEFHQGDQVTKPTYNQGAQVISAETAAKVREMLVGVVDFGHGKKAKVDGIKVGGKTGTAQVPDPNGGYYTDKTIGTFAGMFPADDPKYVMIVELNNPKSVSFAESSAAPTFGLIANWMTTYFQLR